jgi:hypothetical protein
VVGILSCDKMKQRSVLHLAVRGVKEIGMNETNKEEREPC